MNQNHTIFNTNLVLFIIQKKSKLLNIIRAAKLLLSYTRVVFLV